MLTWRVVANHAADNRDGCGMAESRHPRNHKNKVMMPLRSMVWYATVAPEELLRMLPSGGEQAHCMHRPVASHAAGHEPVQC